MGKTHCRYLLVLCSLFMTSALFLWLSSLNVMNKHVRKRLDNEVMFSTTLPVVNTTTEHIWSELVTSAARLLFSPTKRERRVPEVNCRKIIEGDSNEIRKAHMLMAKRPVQPLSDRVFIELTNNCSAFVSGRGYLTAPASDEEANFPIAFSILMYKEVEQAERLLRSIYQPQNIYCIHVDRDSPEELHQAMRNIASCFENVFIASRLEKIVYAGFSRLQADINCMMDLINKNVSWKYFINQPSQAFPLRSNAELVKILKVYNGSNDIEGSSVAKKLPWMKTRFEYEFELRSVEGSQKPQVDRTKRRKGTPPYGLNITKGSAYGVFSRDFVHFLLHDPISLAFLKWCRDTYSPDEHYWSTLHHTIENPNLHPPGGYAGVAHEKPWLAAYALWWGEPGQSCHGKYVRGVCVFGIEDLKNVTKRKEFFANKFYFNYQPLALDCLEQYLYNRTIRPQSFNLTYYKQLPFVGRKG